MSKANRPAIETTALPRSGRQRRRWCQGAAGLWLAGLNLGLAGCGGGGAEGSSPLSGADDVLRQPLSGVDSGGTGVMATNFVSADIDIGWPLTVNGIAYDTADSRIVDGDDQPLRASDLLPGMSCQIEATGPRGPTGVALARRVRIAEQLRAPVTTVDGASRSFTALGQRVVITAGTRFDGALAAGLPALQAGLWVQVWGQLDTAGGRIVATRVGLAAGSETGVVRGVLARLDREQGRIRIGGLQAATAAGQAALIPADLQVGDVVRARLATEADGSRLLALQADALQLPDRVAVDIEGRISRVDGARRFAVDGVTVDATGASATALAALLTPGTRVAVQGRAVQGRVLATRLRVEPDEPLEVEGSISAVDAQRQTFVVKGLSVAWSASTVFEGGPASLLQARRRVAVVGRWNVDRSVLDASHVHVEA